MLKLAIGNKNYSSWSMRPWVLMTHFALPFEEIRLRFDDFTAPGYADSPFRRRVAELSPAARVPVLLLPDGFPVWDTLAIAETLAERHAELPLWPREPAARARARSVCAEMHAGFGALRSHCPMNIEASLPEVGPRLLAEQPALRADLQRIVEMWSGLLAAHGGPFLFGDFCNADAYFAPVCTRIRSYGLPVPGDVAGYVERVFESPGVAAWVRDALAERDFLAFEEPYRRSRD